MDNVVNYLMDIKLTIYHHLTTLYELRKPKNFIISFV